MSLRQSSTVDCLHPLSRYSTCHPDMAGQQTPPRSRCVFDSSTRPTRGSPPVAPTEFDSSNDTSRRIGPDACDSSDSARRVARRVWPAARLVRRRVPSRRIGPDACDSSDSSCRAARPASGPTRPRRRVPADRARLVRLLRLLGRVARRVCRPASGPTRPTTRPVGSGRGPTRATATRQTFRFVARRVRGT